MDFLKGVGGGWGSGVGEENGTAIGIATERELEESWEVLVGVGDDSGREGMKKKKEMRESHEKERWQ